MRHDTGDAEAGFGVEVGGGLAWSAPVLGFSAEVEGRDLFAHEDDGLEGGTYAASVAFDPRSDSGTGSAIDTLMLRKARRGVMAISSDRDPPNLNQRWGEKFKLEMRCGSADSIRASRRDCHSLRFHNLGSQAPPLFPKTVCVA